MRVILCTVPQIELGRSIARALVEEGLAACAQVDLEAIESCYRWEGRVEVEREHRLTIKTAPSCVLAVRERIAALHSYSVPQIVDFEASANPLYLAWLESVCVAPDR